MILPDLADTSPFPRAPARRGRHIAAVAVARMMAVVVWRVLASGEGYAWGSPPLLA